MGDKQQEGSGESAILIRGYMLTLQSLSSGLPLPPVDPTDMRRVWELWSNVLERQTESSGGVGLDVRFIREQCSQGADPVAVWARVALLGTLLGTGLLDNWRDGDQPNGIVFETLARFPVPEGIQNFRPEEFLASLRKAV